LNRRAAAAKALKDVRPSPHLSSRRRAGPMPTKQETNVQDKEFLESIEDIWTPAAQMATVGIFILLLGAFLYFARPVLLPVVAAIVIGTTLAPLVKFAGRYGAAPWLATGVITVVLLVAAGTAATFLAKPVTDWVARAPEIGAAVRQKLYVLDRPLAALRELQEALLPSAGPSVSVEPSQLGIVTPVLTFLTPAVVQLVLFFVTLIFFLAAQMDFRRYVVSFFGTREGKLRFIRIAGDIEQHLASYVAIVSVINFCLGVVVAFGAWLFGFPSPVLFGILAAVLNYIPYIGAACVTAVLFAVGVVTFPSFAMAAVPPAAFVGLATIEGQFITPTVLGQRLTLNPLAVILALAFWSWIWGPMGTFLAVPLTMIGFVTLNHVFPPDQNKLPG
jgi:predicted PurR-regulated permease PerM